MELLFQTPSHAEAMNCSDGALCLWQLETEQGERRALALHVVEHGIEDFPRGAGPVTRIVLQAVPTLDDMLAATLAARILEGAAPPAGTAAFARYAAVVRDGLRPNGDISPECSLEAIYLAIRTNAGGDLADPNVAKRFVEDWRRLERRILEAAEAGVDPFTTPLFGDGSEFGRERAFLRRDQEVYEQDVAGGERWSVRIPNGPPRANGLLLRRPRSLLFQIWSRSGQTAKSPDGKGYLFLAVRTDERVQWIFSTDRVHRLSLKGLVDELQKAEIRKNAARAERQRWFDGQPFDHTLVAAPTEGTILSDEEVLEVVKRWSGVMPVTDDTAGDAGNVATQPLKRETGDAAPRPLKPETLGAAAWIARRWASLGVVGRATAALAVAGVLLAELWFGWPRPVPPPKPPDSVAERGLRFWPVSPATWVSDDAIGVLEPRRTFATTLSLTSPSRRRTHATLSITMQGDGLPREGELGEVRVTVNRGRTQLAKLIRTDASHIRSDKIDADVQPLDNLIEIRYDHPAIERDVKVHVGMQYACEQSELPGLYVLTIGVSKYQAPGYQLAYADADATAITKLFKSGKQPLFKAVNAKEPLVNDKAKREDIVTALDHIGREVADGDLVLVAFSGHGAVANGKFYFLPYDFNPDPDKPLSASAVSHDTILEHLRALVDKRSCQVLLLLDACESGAANGGLKGSEESEAAAQEAAKLWSVDNPKGIALTTACLPTAKAMEDGKWGHGALSLALIEVLTNQRSADLKSHEALRPTAGRLVTWQFVDNYLHNRVIELTGGRQFVNTHPDMSLDLIPIAVNEPPDKPAQELPIP